MPVLISLKTRLHCHFFSEAEIYFVKAITFHVSSSSSSVFFFNTMTSVGAVSVRKFQVNHGGQWFSKIRQTSALKAAFVTLGINKKGSFRLTNIPKRTMQNIYLVCRTHLLCRYMLFSERALFEESGYLCKIALATIQLQSWLEIP